MADEIQSSLENSLKNLKISNNRLNIVKINDKHLPVLLNPFQRRYRSRSSDSIYLNSKSKIHFKPKQKKTILREPILKIASKYSLGIDSKLKSNRKHKVKKETDNDFNSLLHDCEKLNIDDELVKFHKEIKLAEKYSDNNNRTTANNPSCSQEAIAGMALQASTCDVTIDELASYFETFVYIPKKMSSMAEMMYI